MKEVLRWIGEHWTELILVGFIIRFGGKLFKMLVEEPLQGDDGRTSMDEFAKYAIVIYLGLVLYRIGSGNDNYSPEIVLYLVLGVAMIAGLKPLIDIFLKKNKNEAGKSI